VGRLTEDMKRVLREQRLGYVATVRPDGTPSLSPKATTTAWDEDRPGSPKPVTEPERGASS
jgi:uncharacterized protein